MDDNSTIRQWVAFYESSGLTQSEFEKKHGIPGRTLRSWRRKFRATRQPPAVAVREAIEQAIEALTAVRDRLAAACREADVPVPMEVRTDDQATSSGGQPGAAGSSPAGLVPHVLPGAVASTVQREGPGPGPASPPGASAAPAAVGKVPRRGFFSSFDA